MENMKQTIVTCTLVTLCLLSLHCSNAGRYELPGSSSGSRGLRLDGAGRVYVSAGSSLYRLSSDLVLEERRNLTSDVANISLSTDGRWLVACLTDLSCEVYNATNLADQPVFRRQLDAFKSADNFALFAAEDSFYVGSIVVGPPGVAQMDIVLGQYGFTGDRVGVEESGLYDIDRPTFVRNMYGGFVRGDYAYYFAVDNDPNNLRNIKVMRVCHNSNFAAMYELELLCSDRILSTDTRIAGVSLVDNFGGISGPIVVLTRSRPVSSQNYVCLYSLDEIDRIMEGYFNTCLAGGVTVELQIDISWQNRAGGCDELSSANFCNFGGTLRALGDIEHLVLAGDFRINHGGTNQNFITASAAALIDSFSFVFLAYTDRNGDTFIIGYDAGSTADAELSESAGFDRRSIADGPVRQLQLNAEARLIYAVTDTFVLQFPIADCTSHSDCTSCLGGNPLCGWCVVENKCSEINECQNSVNASRWIRAANNPDQCPVISVTPEQYVVDNPETLTLSLTQSLPSLFDGEAYLCHFSSNGVSFTVDAVGSGTSYTCNITGRLPPQVRELSTAFNVSFISSLIQIPFSTSISALTVYQCGATTSCSECLQTDNACGWCIYNKVCSGTPDPCISGTDNYLQPNLGMSQTFADVCPLLDQPSTGQNYTQPVALSRNIELVTRNLPAEIDGFNYACRVNGVDLQATYNNATSVTCAVNANQLTLPNGVGKQPVSVSVRWIEQGNAINHPIDAVTPVSVILFNCDELADGCSSCLGSGFDCGWCGGAIESCIYTRSACDTTLVTMGNECPAPLITDFNPKSGPIEGGTTITITGRELGVTFDDFSAMDSITVGGAPCTPVDRDSYVPGRWINCITTSGGSTGSKVIQITLSPSRTADSGSMVFEVVTPRIERVSPTLGPVAGGTKVTVFGSNLNIGNIEDTRITVVGGSMCEVEQASIQANSINCTTPMFNGSEGSGDKVIVAIDNAMVSNVTVRFTFAPNPEFYSVSPSKTILAGGIELIFNGSNLDSVQNPVLVIQDQNFDVNMSVCTVINSTAISCITPSLTRLGTGMGNGLTYTIRVDDAPGLEPNIESLQITVLPNPGNFRLVNSDYNVGSSALIRIMGDDLESVRNDFFQVTVGGESCQITAVLQAEIICIPPTNPPRGVLMAPVTVSIGAYLRITLDDNLIYNPQGQSVDLGVIIPSILIPLLALILILAVVFVLILFFFMKRTRKEVLRVKYQAGSKDDLILTSVIEASGVELLKQVPSELLISSNQLQLSNKSIGQGEFGVVYKGQLTKWRGRSQPLTVAVKTVKGLFTTSDIEGMVSEMSKMKEFDHPNVMSLIGVCLDAGPGVSIVMPFMANGSLLDYLRKERDKLYLSETNEIDDVLSARKLLMRVCHQIASGMEYLASQKFVHRDLAARNCMLDMKGNVRVGDFGLAEDIYTSGYFRQDKRDAVKLPFKWMAPESLRDGLFSEKSDVWSFGVTCWEVFTVGRIPYPGVDAMDMLKILERGTRLEKPSNAACAPENFSVMVKCWALDPEDRPSFEKLSSTLGKLLQTAAGYLELNMALLPETTTENSYYEVIAAASSTYTNEQDEVPTGEEYENLEVSVQSHEEETKDFSMTENSAYGDSHVTASSGDGLLTSKDGERDVVMVNNNAYGSLNEPPN